MEQFYYWGHTSKWQEGEELKNKLVNEEYVNMN
jgi:hypothetical protein